MELLCSQSSHSSQAAHDLDTQEESAFHEAIKELHDRVMAKRNATEQLDRVRVNLFEQRLLVLP